jgi:hypothetical protein
MRERTMPANIRTRAQAKAAILTAKEMENGDLVQEQAN